MNRNFVKTVTFLYPKAWRERYAEELADLCEECLDCEEMNRLHLGTSLIASGLLQRLRAFCGAVQRAANVRRTGLVGAALGGAVTALALFGSSTFGPVGQAGASALCPTGEGHFCYTPQVFRNAYGITPLLQQGIEGKGSTIGIINGAVVGGAQGATDLSKDLYAYDARFGLAPAHVQVVTRFAPTASSHLASAEEVEDVEMAHVVAPAATVRVFLLPVEATPVGSSEAFLRVLDYAITRTDILSLSTSPGEACVLGADVTGLQKALSDAAARRVTVVAPSGGAGSVTCGVPQGQMASARGVNLPASDPLVLGVGGTGAGASFWAGVIALGDQYAGRDLGLVNPAIYRIAESPQYHVAFHDITEGNGDGFRSELTKSYSATPIRGPATGWGTPKVAALVPLLAQYTKAHA